MPSGDERLLLIDTCGAPGRVGLSAGDVVVDEVALPGRSGSALIASAVRGLLEMRGWRLADLHGVGVASGPGSFTGLRTGLAFAKGLCEAAGMPLALVSRLAVLARAGGVEQGVAVLDGGREGFYVRQESSAGVASERLCTLEELLALAAGQNVVAGDTQAAERLGLLSPRVHTLALRDMIALVHDCLRERGTDLASSDANYVRGESDIYGSRSHGSAAGGVLE